MNSIRGRRPGTSSTRGAIAEAARRSFAAVGYDRTSVRAVARAAGVDPSLVFHFYGSKQALFAAATGPPPGLATLIAGALEGDRAGSGERLARVLVGLLERDEVRTRITGMVRAAASEPAAAALVRDLLAREVYRPFAAALGGADAELRATLVGSQVVGLVMARYVVGLEPLASLDAEALAAAIAPALQRFLTDAASHTLA
jgi:AcrR family transcriptional regulator